MTSKRNNLLLNQRIADTGIFIALFLGLGYIFLYVPNVEFISLIAWLAAFWLGLPAGLLVAVVGEAIFSVMNPMGSSLAYPPLFAAQIMAFAVIAVAGGINRYFVEFFKHGARVLTMGVAAVNGLMVTVVYDSLTTLAFPVASGFSMEQTIATVIVGIPFMMLHIVSNTIIFALLIPILIPRAAELFPRFRHSGQSA